MFLQKGFLPLLIAVSIQGILTSPPPPPTAKKIGGHPPLVYTAEKAREQPPAPYPTYNSPNVGTTLDELYDESKAEGTKKEPENTGFVEPLDFNSFLTQVGSSSGGKKSDYLPVFGSESKQKDTFAGFFNTKDDFAEPNFAGLSSASSNQKSRKPNDEDDQGFVDPNVQFRSLFDSSETANGFRPEDFLGSKDNSAGVDPSKGSQTQAFPSFTYTGRNGRTERPRQENDGDHEPQQNRFRSSYRQVDSRNDRNGGGRGDRGDSGERGGERGGDYTDRNDRNDRQSSFDPYDDSNYYGGEYDDSPSAPPNPRPSSSNNNNNKNTGYNNQRYSQRQGEAEDDESEDDKKQTYSPAVQESSHSPQASGSGPKPAESKGGKGKCKKIQKEVAYDENEDYAGGYTDPEPDYDPSTYGRNDRYKRQANRAANKKKSTRPMTCYVCEDEQGRYAERCEYDSKGDPKSGNYFHSSSSSFNDNGNKRGPRGGRGSGSGGSGSERYRRNPAVAASAKVTSTTAASVSTAQSVNVPETTENISDRDKRQSNRGRNQYEEDDYNNEGERGNNNRERERDYDTDSRNNNSNNNDGDYDEGRSDEDYGPGSSRSGSNNRNNNNRDNDDYGASSEAPSSSPRSQGGSGGAGGRNNYGFGPPSTGGNRGGNSGRGGSQEFDFGPPSDFGRDTSSSGTNNRGFRDFDFSIPREFDPDVQLRGSNTNNRPIFSGSNNNNNNNFGGEGSGFDFGYEDHIKKYFPDAFGSGQGSGSGSGSTPGPAPASSSYRPSGPSSSSSRPHTSHGSTPNKEHTQQSHNYAPAPYYHDESGGGLEKLMGDFGRKDRSGCQKVQKEEMTCYVCRDARGMNKEECMYASNDPNGKNTRMAYHESTEYSSPPIMVVPFPRSKNPSLTSTTTPKPASKDGQESKVVEKKLKSPLDYDFED